MRYLKLLLSGLLLYFNSYSQAKRNNHWYFGQRAGLDFNFTPPLPSNHSPMDQEEGSASISDVNGNLLCYTDGLTIWNKNHQVMMNGTGLAGGFSASQSALIVPKPSDNNILYVFTVPNQSTTHLPMTYSIVDMSLENGLGAVTSKNEPLYYDVDEKLTGTLHSNGIDYWIVAKKSSSDIFVAYSLTTAGLNTTPVISHAGSVFTHYSDKIGYVRISPNGSKLCIAYRFSGMTQLFDYDNNSGIVSNPIDLPGDPYSVAFSEDNSKLYITHPFGQQAKVVQYNLQAGSPVNIQNSAYTVIQPFINLGFQEAISGIALAPDGKIYISFYHRRYMGVINDPNLPGAACNYVHKGIWLEVNSRNNLGVPNQIYYPATLPCSPLQFSTINVSICEAQLYQLPSGLTVSSAGIYFDTIKNLVGTCDSIAFAINLSITSVSRINFESHICPGQQFQLPSGTIVSNAGVYQDTIRTQNYCDSIIYTINVIEDEVSYTSLTDSIFPGQSYTLPTGTIVNTPGSYSVTLTNQAGCDSLVTIFLRQIRLMDCLDLRNAFTPNGDGTNDNWKLYRYRCFKKLGINVYNRYGSLVYQSDDYNNNWDGRYLNKHLPDGTYYYVLKVMTYNDQHQHIKGNVTILR